MLAPDHDDRVKDVRAIAVDLPGIGESTGDPTDGSKGQLATVVRGLVEAMGLQNLTLVGQDVGGMVTYAYLRMFPDLRQAVIMDVVIPGIDPWQQVLRNPHLWHFAFHSIPELPEELVQGHQGEYFDYFYGAISADPSKITAEVRALYAQAYSTDSALTAGFNWYRTFPVDAEANKEATNQAAVATRVLYLRGEKEGGDLDDYLGGLRVCRVVSRSCSGAKRRTLHARGSPRRHLATDRRLLGTLTRSPSSRRSLIGGTWRGASFRC